jgi:RND family efflux transporter MFP subunit
MKLAYISMYLACASLLAGTHGASAQGLGKQGARANEVPMASLGSKIIPPPTSTSAASSASRYIKSAVIVPFRSADVPSDARGVVTAFNFDRGDLVQRDQAVVEISKDRYAIMVQMARTKLEGLKLTLHAAEQNLAFKKEVYSKHYGTKQKLLEAEAEVSVTKHKVDEARRELDLARLNLEACIVKAPFTGYVADRYKEPHEAVNQLDKLFRLVDMHKVYAVANVPEHQLPGFKKDASAWFIDGAERRFRGKVDKMEPVLCPESKTAKIYVLIENPDSALRVGTTGALSPE